MVNDTSDTANLDVGVNKQPNLRWNGGKIGLNTPRLCPYRITNTSFMVLCKWIKTRHLDKSSPDEPRLEKL